MRYEKRTGDDGLQRMVEIEDGAEREAKAMDAFGQLLGLYSDPKGDLDRDLDTHTRGTDYTVDPRTPGLQRTGPIPRRLNRVVQYNGNGTAWVTQTFLSTGVRRPYLYACGDEPR